MKQETIVIVYLSISLLIVQALWMKDAKAGAYQKGRAEVLEIMAELTYDPKPYTKGK